MRDGSRGAAGNEAARRSFEHRFVPARSGGASETLVLLHGTGGDEDSLVWLGRALAPHAALLSPRGKVLERGASRFFRRHPSGALDVEDLKFRTEELADFVEEAALDYGFDPRGVVAVGYSNGANVAGGLLLLRPGFLRGAVLLRPAVPLVPEVIPDLGGTPVLVAGGRKDPMVPPEETGRLAGLLRAAGAEVTLRWHDGGHALGHEELEGAQEWLSRKESFPKNEPRAFPDDRARW